MSARTLSRLAALFLVLGVLSWLAPSQADDRPDFAAVAVEGDAAYDAREYRTAALHYRDAFALLDPADPERTEVRAVMAMKASRALVRWATAAGTEEGVGRSVAWIANRWIGVTLSLDPDQGFAWLERANLFDGPQSPLPDPSRAIPAYRAFVGWARTADHTGRLLVPEPELIRSAEMRLEELEAERGG